MNEDYVKSGEDRGERTLKDSSPHRRNHADTLRPVYRSRRLLWSRYLGISISGSIFGIAIGVIALYGHSRLGGVVWAVILAVLGYFAGGLGGLLVLLGSLIALIMHFV